MKTFYHLLANTLIAGVTTFFVWFALTYWAYLETNSVLATSIISGLFLVFTATSSFWFGSIVDHNKKKAAMLWSSLATLACFIAGFAFYWLSPDDAFTTVASWRLWALVFVLMLGVIAGNIRNITMPILVTILIPEDSRDRANGMLGSTIGVAFAITSIASGLVLGFAGMFWVLASAVIFTAIAIAHLSLIGIPENEIVHTEEKPKKLDIKGTIGIIKGIPGLFGLIFFTTFNNFLGGVFMSLMDAYGLSLVSVKTWGVLWGFLSLGFIVGGLYISKYGLGKSPLRTLFRINTILWTVCIFFTAQPSIILLAAGSLIYISLVPFLEATEHTIIQKVVPVERQGRVFGFAQSIEQAASPITAFLIGPVAQFIFIPFMTTGKGVDLIGSWYGTGVGRGIGLVFTLAGIVGLCVTLAAKRTRSYKTLSKSYETGSAANAA